MSAPEYTCLYCVIYELNYVLYSTDYFNVSDRESLSLCTSQLQNCEIIRRIFAVVLYLQLSQNDSSVMNNIFLDTETLEDLFITLTNNTLDTKAIRREVDRVMKENSKEKSNKFGKVKNCGFQSECRMRPLLWILYTIAIAENGLLILIFIRHSEMRSDRNIIILNLAVADILSVLCNASLQIIFIYGGTFESVKIYYRIMDLSLEVSTGVCIYSIVVLSIQRYFAVIPTYRCRECGLSRRFNSTLFVFVLWSVGCVPQIIHLTTNMSIQAWAMRNLILYCVVPIVAIATFYLMTSWRLRQSVRKMPGEAVRQETARHARVRSSNVLIALIAVFVISYTPIQVFRFIELWFYGGGYLFDYVDLIAYSLLSLNSCFNPIALYVASGTFRRYYNKYICYSWKNSEMTMSSSNINIQSTNKTCILHI
jgi:gastrin-releasing peptide receptor/ATP-dependent RNA helicase UAP56/SUB2